MNTEIIIALISILGTVITTCITTICSFNSRMTKIESKVDANQRIIDEKLNRICESLNIKIEMHENKIHDIDKKAAQTESEVKSLGNKLEIFSKLHSFGSRPAAAKSVSVSFDSSTHKY